MEESSSKTKLQGKHKIWVSSYMSCVIRYASHLVKEKYLNPEVNQFTKKGAPWSEFKLTDKTKDAVRKHLDSKMTKYKAGDVNKV